MERSHISEISAENEGKKVLLKGWVHETRDLGKIRFLLLKDISGMIQITALKDKTAGEVFETLSKIPHESVISVEGEVKKSKQAPEGREIFPSKIEILAKSEPILPIDVSDFSKTELSKRLDYRFLDMHSLRTRAIFKIQSEISVSFREFFSGNGFIEIQRSEERRVGKECRSRWSPYH